MWSYYLLGVGQFSSSKDNDKFSRISAFCCRLGVVCAVRAVHKCPLTMRCGQGIFRIIKNKTPSPPLQTKVAIVGKNEIYNRETHVGPILVHKVLGPKPPPPLPSPAQKTPGVWVVGLLCACLARL